MSHFYAEIQGNRSARTCMGTEASGIWGHIRGWEIGARVDILHDKDQNKDIVRVYKTHGSNGGGSDEFIAEFAEE